MNNVDFYANPDYAAQAGNLADLERQRSILEETLAGLLDLARTQPAKPLGSELVIGGNYPSAAENPRTKIEDTRTALAATTNAITLQRKTLLETRADICRNHSRGLLPQYIERVKVVRDALHQLIEATRGHHEFVHSAQSEVDFLSNAQTLGIPMELFGHGPSSRASLLLARAIEMIRPFEIARAPAMDETPKPQSDPPDAAANMAALELLEQEKVKPIQADAPTQATSPGPEPELNPMSGANVCNPDPAAPPPVIKFGRRTSKARASQEAAASEASPA